MRRIPESGIKYYILWNKKRLRMLRCTHSIDGCEPTGGRGPRPPSRISLAGGQVAGVDFYHSSLITHTVNDYHPRYEDPP